MKEGKSGFFWTSYSDLMTSLFFVMLALYVLTYVKLRADQEQYRIDAQRFKQLQNLQNSIESIDKRYFVYDSTHRKHVLNIEVKFNTKSFNINDVAADKQNDLKTAGKSIRDFVGKDTKLEYLIIIEGQASKYGDEMDNYELSYKRALSLLDFWRNNGINLREIPNCELLLSGSGIYGVPRRTSDERANQRFLIHIIPKIGSI
jgi:hypothetical protein